MREQIVVVDSEWPAFKEIIQLLQSEPDNYRLVVIALLTPRNRAKEARHAGAEFLLDKHLRADWVRKVLKIVLNLVTQEGAWESTPGATPNW